MNKMNVAKVITLLFVILAMASPLTANGRNDNDYNYGYGHMGRGYGHMGPGGGYGPGMMGYGYYNGRNGAEGDKLPREDIEKILESYVAGAFGKDFSIREIMEFQRNYYAQVGKDGEDYLAVELLVDPYTGRVGPEPGPNMMWNLSYGHMGRWNRGQSENPISSKEAVEIAQKFLDYNNTGFTAEDHADPFDGYYTLHTLRDGHITGMLSVNSYTREVWFHDWHGDFMGEG